MAQAARLTTSLRRLVDVLLLALIGVVLFGVILAKLVPLSGHETIVVGGPSMQPAIPIGAAIVVGPIDPNGIAVGDVVTMKPGQGPTLVTHRVTEVVEKDGGIWIRTRGDANATPDPVLVPATKVVGRVDVAIPMAGYLIALLSIPAGILLILCVAGTLLAAAWLLESLELDRAEELDRVEALVADEAGNFHRIRVPERDAAASAGEPIASRMG
jgi:signal peptidase